MLIAVNNMTNSKQHDKIQSIITCSYLQTIDSAYIKRQLLAQPFFLIVFCTILSLDSECSVL